ncbi:MAG: rhodanese-like domain-containing protein [Rhodobacterales bacterium]|nr:rhodanese-like domain-containing protein [Rhodobacterales bacterium]
MTDPAPTDVDAQTAKAWMDAGEAVMVDVREASEYEYENVPGSVLLPLSFLDPAVFPAITDKKIIFMCAVGKRAEAARLQVAQAGVTRNAFNLIDGIKGWRDAGLDTQGGKFEALDYTI